MKKTTTAILDVLLFTLGFLGVQMFMQLHTLLVQIRANVFGYVCVMIAGVVLIYFKNRKGD